MGGVSNGRPDTSGSSDRGRSRTRSGAKHLAVLLAIAGLIASCAGPAPSLPPASSPTPYPPSPMATSGATSGTPTSTVTPAPFPSSGPQAWTRVTVAGIPAVADLAPTRAGTGGVAVDTAFRLTSLDGRAPAALAARLVSDPPLTFIVASVDGAAAVVRPSAPLRTATLYRISLARPDGSAESSWAAQTAGPLTVVGTIPGDQATGVPLATGIEIMFDQSGVAATDLRDHFTISPAVTGSFKAAGRTIAFVPTAPLRKGRVYTVTVTHGLPLAGTGQVLAHDVVFQFETEATAASDVSIRLGRTFLEANPRERPAMTIYVDVPEDGTTPRSVPVTVHRLAGLTPAMHAWETIQKAPDWTLVATTPAVSTAGLTRVIKSDLKVQAIDEGFHWIQLPKRLAIGWYLVTLTWAGSPHQAVLQVTDIATFSLLAADRSAVWVNNLATKGAAAGATVAIGGQPLGVTDSRGLVVATTPTTVVKGEDPWTADTVVVRYKGRSAFQPVALNASCLQCTEDAQNAWWHLFSSDRSRFRSTDTVNAWGVVRNRDTGVMPASVSVTLLPAESSNGGEIPIATTRATPDKAGAFAISVAFKDLPIGGYRLVLTAGKVQLGELWVEVATIVKPAYRLAMTTDRHAVVAGAKVTASVDASFFEGTPVAGTELSLFSVNTEDNAKATTNATGDATGKVAMDLDPGEGQWGVVAIQAIPTLPEEAEISTMSDVAVFRATALVDTAATLSGTRVTVSGKVSDVVFDRFEKVLPTELANVEPRGAGRANASVRIRVIEHTTVRHQTGTAYDFVLKRASAVYDYSDRTKLVATRTVRTGADGKYGLSLTVTGGSSRQYEAFASYTDEGGRQVTESAMADGPVPQYGNRGAWLEAADPGHDSGEYSIGETVRVRFMGGLEKPPVARYFYAITGRGLQYATVGGSRTFRTTFKTASLPSIGISGVRFNGFGYDMAVTSLHASLRLADRRLTVQVTPDQARYAPGQMASVTVRTLDAGGRPVAASVFVQAVDEKLYAIGAADQVNPLDELYASIGDRVMGWAASHRTPADDYGDGQGDATGGGGDDRTDFKDWLISRLITTGTDGRARVTIPLSDDLTSWRVTAAAVDAALEAGTGSGLLPVGLPFFVEATVAPEYLVVDRPIIRVRAFGSGLATGERVTFTVSSDTLLMSGVTVTADAFAVAEVPLPALAAGSHRLRIEATVGSGATLRRDALVRTFEVVTTRTSRLQTTWSPLDAPVAAAAGSGLTRITLVDAGRGRVVPVLQDLAWTDGGRSDRVIAAGLANRVLVEQFGLDPVNTAGESDLSRFSGGDGITLVSYGSSDLDVSALAAMARDPRFGPVMLAEFLRPIAADPDTTRDRRLLALAGLAGLGEPVLADVRDAAGQPDLTTPERIDVAIAAFYAGDEALARSIEQDLLATLAFRLGPWVRIDPGKNADAAVQTARLAIVAASLGDPVAAEMDAWVAANPPRATTVALERVLAARGWAQRVAGASAVAAVTVDGTRREVTIEPGAPATVVLTPSQAAGARLEPVSGSVLAITSVDAALDPASLTPANGQKLERIVSPAGAIGSTDTVIVTLRVTLGPDARDECWRVTDLAPSGLAPISVVGTWYDEERPWTRVSPDFVDGQRVEFCVMRAAKPPVQDLRYVARVVTPGTYLWEPAVLQSELVPDQGVVTAPVTVTIKGIGG